MSKELEDLSKYLLDRVDAHEKDITPFSEPIASVLREVAYACIVVSQQEKETKL